MALVRNEFVLLCGGFIYDEHHVITAAHCCEPYNTDVIEIIAGDHDIMIEEGKEQVIECLN